MHSVLKRNSVLKRIITEPSLLAAQLDRLSAKHSGAAMESVRQLLRLSANELLASLFNTYFYYAHGSTINDFPLVPQELVAGYASVDELYYNIESLYKHATGVIAPRRQEVIVHGVAQRVEHATGTGAVLVILKNPLLVDGVLTVDPTAELHFIVYY